MTYTVPAGRYSDTSADFIQAYIDQSIQDLVGASPESLDTLQELADALGDNPDAINNLVTNLQAEIDRAQAAEDAIQAELTAEEAASAAYDIQQDNRISVLEIVNEINKKELSYITLVGSASPATGQVGVNSFTPSAISMLVLPKTDADGKTIVASDFLEGDRIGLKQTNGSAAVYFVDDSFDFGDHIRINVDDTSTVLGAAADQLFVENDSVNAVFEDNSVTRASATAGFTTASDARTILQGLIDALEARADALEVDPTTATALAAVQADVDANELASDNAETALSGRLDTLEADATTATAVAAVQADVDANETASDVAEAALSGRLDVLEADPTTKAYVDTQVAGLVDSAPGVLNTLDELAAALGDDANFASTITNSIAAVQLDVDNNETASDNAEAALSTRLDTLEADPTTATAVAAVQTDVDANEASRKTYFDWDSNLTKVINPVRSSRIDVGNNITFYPAAGYNTEIKGNLTTDNTTKVFFTLTDAADDAAAATAGVDVGQLYRNGSVVMIRVS